MNVAELGCDIARIMVEKLFPQETPEKRVTKFEDVTEFDPQRTAEISDLARMITSCSSVDTRDPNNYWELFKVGGTIYLETTICPRD